VQRRTAMVTSVTAIVVGCAAAVAVPLVYSARSPDGAAPVPTFGSGAPTILAEESPTTPATVPTSSIFGGSVASPSTTVAGTPTSVSVPRPSVPTAAPIDVTISGTGISAPVVAVGVDNRGDMAIPKRVDTVGWYRFGPRPGASAGSIVLVGHVDSAQQGEGAFFRLHMVRKGAVVSVTGTDHHVFRYRVVGRQEYPKTSVPLEALFTRGGAPHLTLITCGGSFDPSGRSYRDNVVVTAVPVVASR
jgi:Sortase domain